MFCSISGHVPEEPVVNSKTGQLYEKRLIEKTVQDTGRDPFSNEPLSLDDLVEVKSNKVVKPRPSPATSIPGLLNLFQQEWDALMLEMHQIRQALSTSRQELSFSLYMQDAASRVIARLVRERDGARTLAENAQRALEAAPAASALANGKRPAEGDVDMADAPDLKRVKAGITQDIIDAMTALSTSLSATRKKRVISPGIASMDAIQGFSLLSSHPLHKTTQGGILAIDTAPDNEQLVATAGSDHTVHLFDRSTERVTANLVGHSKKVTDVRFLKSSSSLVTTSADKTARLWVLNPETSTYQPTVLHTQGADVTAVAPLASRAHFITTSLDKTWCFYDAESATCLQQVADDSVEAGFFSASMHPDGIILGTGTQDSVVHLWETRTQKGIAKFEGHKGPVTSLSFSENGYYLATAATDGVKLWDLRKLRNIRTLTPYETGQATAVAFDLSGLYLAVTGSDDARVYGAKQDWSLLSRFADLPAKGGLSLDWGKDAQCLYVGASDHNLRIYGSSAAGGDAA